MQEFKRIIIVTGTPSVGKTAVSRLLSFKLGAIHVDLSALVEREGLILEVDQARGTSVADVESVAKRVREIAANSDCDLIVEGHYAADVVSAKKVPHVFVLRRDPYELKKEMENRGFEERKLWENLAAEILDICLADSISAYGLDRISEIDVTGRSVHDVVDDILSVLEGKQECGVGRVDWLGKLEEKGQLKEFLRHF